MSQELLNKQANTIRFLSTDMIQKANQGILVLLWV